MDAGGSGGQITQDLISCYRMLAFTPREIRSKRRVAEQRSDKTIHFGYCIENKLEGYKERSKREAMVSWTRQGRQRAEGGRGGQIQIICQGEW